MALRDRFLFGSVWNRRGEQWLEAAPGRNVRGRRGHEAVVDSAAVYEHPVHHDDNWRRTTAVVWLREGFDESVVFVDHTKNVDSGERQVEVRDVAEIDASNFPPFTQPGGPPAFTHPEYGRLAGDADPLEPVRVAGPRTFRCPRTGHAVVFGPTGLRPLSSILVLYDDSGAPRVAFAPVRSPGHGTPSA